jgi:hypothetical protein
VTALGQLGTTDNNFGFEARPVDKGVFVLFLSTALLLDRVQKKRPGPLLLGASAPFQRWFRTVISL